VQPVVLFCKSYRDDVLRARRLLESVQRFNSERLPMVLSVPAADADLFRERCAGLAFELITDDEIIAANPAIAREAYAQLPGYQAQQVVKAEFWRLGKAENYLCLDSDCYFLRPFAAREFLAPDGAPYTVMHDAKELLEFAEISGMKKIARNRAADCAQIMAIFGREGPLYDFGPVPVVWSARVWQDLEARFLGPRGISFLGALALHPWELRWYGEALLAYQSIPLHPVGPLFRCYHYEEQYYYWKRRGETDETLARDWMGVVRQSAWEKELDLEPRFRWSKLRRRIRRALGGL
jgi:hypothetical protein